MIKKMKNDECLIYKDLIRTVENFPTEGISFKDITPLVYDKNAYKLVIDTFAKLLKMQDCTVIAGVESRGFWFTPAIAIEANLNFLPIRKEGKLPLASCSIKYDLEYGSASIEIPNGLLKPVDKVIIFDDVLATGGTLVGAERLIRETGAEVVSCCTLLNLEVIKNKALPNVPVYTLFSLSEDGNIY